MENQHFSAKKKNPLTIAVAIIILGLVTVYVVALIISNQKSSNVTVDENICIVGEAINCPNNNQPVN